MKGYEYVYPYDDMVPDGAALANHTDYVVYDNGFSHTFVHTTHNRYRAVHFMDVTSGTVAVLVMKDEMGLRVIKATFQTRRKARLWLNNQLAVLLR